MKIGSQVKLVQPVIGGPIVDTEYDKDAHELRHLVEWTDASGDVQQRWFLESELEIV